MARGDHTFHSDYWYRIWGSLQRKTPSEVVDKILELRREYQIGALRIVYYLERYHGIKTSESTVTRVLRAHGVGRLPRQDLRR